MKQAITPCIWFHEEAESAAKFYTSIFKNSKITSASAGVYSISLQGFDFTLLNGGKHFKINEAVSFYIYCEGDDEVERLYEEIKEGGRVLMPLKEYPWCRKYAWVKDKFGVSWQLDVDPINNVQKIVPSILFANERATLIKQALSFYHEIFPNSMILLEDYYRPDMGMEAGTILFAAHKLKNYIFNFMSSHEKHDWSMNEGVSFVLKCKDQDEIDHYWKGLSVNGKEQNFGWLKDQFGVSWQVLPSNLDKYMSKPKNIDKLMKMGKIELSKLEI